MKTPNNQRGAFTVEAVFGITVLMMMMMFIGDLANVLSGKTQSGQVSYAIATATKERLRFFDGRHKLSQQDFELLDSIAGDLLELQAPEKRDGYGLTIEGYNDSDIVAFTNDFDNGEPCQPANTISELAHLRPVRDDGVVFPIYQVTVCIKMDGFSQYFPGMRYVNSSSVLPGR
ncbi:tight adherence pilus pseudopilin TadF [Vibrio gallicus]|uniref:tight adherence pilus pseudopilin TadF n=1 Tax=Vibrio gallicus TaxID=190897 RepID=UPI0021C299A7|nr:tight adherence pilus pseudopilin TadF [Vibrio gallicus]